MENILTTCADLIADIWSSRVYYNDCKCVIAGDFNTNLDSSDALALCVNDFISNCSLVRCDDLFSSQKSTCRLIKRVILTIYFCVITVFICNICG